MFALRYFVSKFCYQQNSQTIFLLLFKKKISLELEVSADAVLPFPLSTGRHAGLGHVLRRGSDCILVSSLFYCCLLWDTTRNVSRASLAILPFSCPWQLREPSPPSHPGLRAWCGCGGRRDGPSPPAPAHPFGQQGSAGGHPGTLLMVLLSSHWSLAKCLGPFMHS